MTNEDRPVAQIKRLDYLDFELEVRPSIGRDYPVSVVKSPAGETEGIMHFPYDQITLESQLKSVELALYRSSGIRRAALSQEDIQIQNFGQALFTALFFDEVRSLYNESREIANKQGKGLRIKLRVKPPELAALPWELMYDSRRQRFVTLSSKTPVVRYIDLAQSISPLTITLPLRILGMVASPKGYPELDVEGEKQRVEKAIADLQAKKLIELTWLPGQTWRDLQKALRTGTWHIFHFIGHGGFNVEADEGYIVIANEQGETQRLSASQLGRLLYDHDALRLTLLNACEGARSGGQDVFSSTASILTREGLPAVLAMQYPISDQAALEFASTFYEALADGFPIDRAVSEARMAISLAIKGTIEWGTPVLYLRSPNGQLFNIEGQQMWLPQEKAEALQRFAQKMEEEQLAREKKREQEVIEEIIKKVYRSQTTTLNLQELELRQLPTTLSQLIQLESLNLARNHLTDLPESIGIGQLKRLQIIDLSNNQLTDLPSSISRLKSLHTLDLKNNPLNPELAVAFQQGLDAVKSYLRAKSNAQVTLNEAKLILVGEGEVGKTCLLDALMDNTWQEHSSTHGIAIQPVNVTDAISSVTFTLNGWDFGGQRVYRPTHQLFFSAPAVYLVVWKPREGTQQGFIKEWITLIKRREPKAKILVVATHGGPQQRQPDIDRQELWDLFGREMVVDFFWVDSKPDANGKRRGIEELKIAIANVVSTLPEVGRNVPKRWQEARDVLAQTDAPYLSLTEVISLCNDCHMDDEEARLWVVIEHRLGHLIHYQHDPVLRDLVVLKPDWLAIAISFILDDEQTRQAHGLVRHSHLSKLWNNPAGAVRYPTHLHPIFIRLMERFDLSYRVVDPASRNNIDPQNLIAQLVSDITPDPLNGWVNYAEAGNVEQKQICRIVDAQNGQTATAEGLFYQLIVRLHKYSLGRTNYTKSVHWQRGLVLDDDYNGRALLEYKGHDVHITVRAAFPERFLVMLTEEVKDLVESFWEGLRCDITVPCLNPNRCIGLLEVSKLIESKKDGHPQQPCPICNKWYPIEQLLHNAPEARPLATAALFAEFNKIKLGLVAIYRKLQQQEGQLEVLDTNDQKLLSRIDYSFAGLMRAFTDEAKEGPRLFSLVPVQRSNFNPKQWTSEKFKLTLWCEHSRAPLTSTRLNGSESTEGVYNIELSWEWFKKAAPFLKFATTLLSLALPVAGAGVKLAMDHASYESIQDELDFGQTVIEAVLDGSEKIGALIGEADDTSLLHGEEIRAHGSILREFHVLLKSIDKEAKFGGLVRVMNKRQEFLWVHPKFEGEY